MKFNLIEKILFGAMVIGTVVAGEEVIRNRIISEPKKVAETKSQNSALGELGYAIGVLGTSGLIVYRLGRKYESKLKK